MHTGADICEASALEQLKARIPYRSNLNYVEEEYDGAAPPGANNRVHLEEEDLLLMWKLFDYASTSTKPNSGRASDEGPGSFMHIVLPGFSETSSLSGSHDPNRLSPNPSADMQGTSSGLEDIAIRSYGAMPLPGGSTFTYSHIDHKSDNSHLVQPLD